MMKYKYKRSASQGKDKIKKDPTGNPDVPGSISRRLFIRSAGIGAIAFGLQQSGCSVTRRSAQQAAEIPPIRRSERSTVEPAPDREWMPVSDRKIRVGIVGYGVSKFGADFGFQNHPNVEIVAVSDLFPDRCAELAKACGCSKTYPSLEELVRDDKIEAVFIATDAPSHAEHVLTALKHGKHVASAVPAVFGSVEDADRLFEAVVKSGLKYMMFETSYFREDLYAMRTLYKKDGLGKIVYSEGEYYHYMSEPIASFRNWRVGLPPQWYPTHSNAYHIGVTGESFTEVSCLGMPSLISHLKPENNRYQNPFGTEIALFRTSGGGTARMGVSWDTPGDSGERGRTRGQRGSYYGKYEGLEMNIPDINRPTLPPGVPPGGHGGSHGYLMDEFVTALLLDRKPLVDIVAALNMTVGGIVAHRSALNDGELIKIPQFG
jgi:predicted dehydrogenase